MTASLLKNKKSQWLAWIGWAIVFGGGDRFVLADKTPTSDSSIPRTVPANNNESTNRDSPTVPAFEELETEAIEFVKKHHPELVTLLQLLKAMRQKEYETAIREIVRVNKKLETLAKRDAQLHEIELDAWKVQSKIDLLLARGFARDKAFDTKTLQGLIKERVEIDKRRLKNEQATLAKRQEQVVELLGRIEGHENERIKQQLTTLMKRVDANTAKNVKPKMETKPNIDAKSKP